MSEEFDLNQAIEQLQQMLSTQEGEEQIQNMIGALTGGQDSKNTEADRPDGGGFNPADLLSGMSDIEGMMKIKNIMSLLGNKQNDANAAFLNSLKPFLKKERRQKLEQASRLMSAAKVFKLFKDSGLGGG